MSTFHDFDKAIMIAATQLLLAEVNVEELFKSLALTNKKLNTFETILMLQSTCLHNMTCNMLHFLLNGVGLLENITTISAARL